MRELNPKFTFFVIIGILLIALFGFTHYQKVNAEQEQLRIDEINRQIESAKSNVFIEVLEPIPTETPYQIYAPPSIRMDTAFNMNQFFNWKSENASGLKDMNVSTTMYGYKILKNFSYYDYNWGKNFNAYAPEGKTYFFAYVYTEMDTVLGGNDTRMYLPQQSNYGLLVDSEMFYPILFDYETNQIRQMDETWNLQHVERIKPYGYEFIYQADEITRINKPVMARKDWLKGGKSNAEDGYIVFEIPEKFNPRMIRLHGNFFSFGSASWKIV
jgi:hypothetical protein